MNILGIETSCDETGAAVVRDGRSVLSNAIASSVRDHEAYGGVIPEIASRKQLEFINSVVKKALAEAGTGLDDIDAFAVTRHPGLLGSLLVGLSFTKALSFALNKPLIEVDHIQAHLYANFLKEPSSREPAPQLPAIGLIVSGGHTSLFKIERLSRFEHLGQTRDDAAGEAFDKVARIMDLGYPGGPIIDKLAKEAGDIKNLRFTPARLEGTFDFSFSGTKTAVLYHVQRHKQDLDKARVAGAFQKSVVDILVQKSIQACQTEQIRTLLIGGGVAANSGLRSELQNACRNNGIALHIPPLAYCMDNAAMIAGFAFHSPDLNPSPARGKRR
ncbi:MAG TPA: tRNA (adenosine(37)-N6)-threonylcarbamoyltransferase complex transferase subunit TsaD [Candidatus Omnitrophota bacterium]|nr:tRNA (adenosine(37)-N6)-threonylcarbamoyltransferase complex transferase subunit TsaD [Candidatus Omnitrophota bacterium]HSA31340.1 tRNA (adenosine(37)-N6)-threonylcarbamoyltransferase complex transferase subunit TsaD [Candidatus Omnitrophota bacterium]